MWGLQATCETIVKNSGGEGAVVCEELLKQKDLKQGYDAQNMTYVNMIDAGIIDPVKVIPARNRKSGCSPFAFHPRHRPEIGVDQRHGRRSARLRRRSALDRRAGNVGIGSADHDRG